MREASGWSGHSMVTCTFLLPPSRDPSRDPPISTLQHTLLFSKIEMVGATCWRCAAPVETSLRRARAADPQVHGLLETMDTTALSSNTHLVRVVSACCLFFFFLLLLTPGKVLPEDDDHEGEWRTCSSPSSSELSSSPSPPSCPVPMAFPDSTPKAASYFGLTSTTE